MTINFSKNLQSNNIQKNSSLAMSFKKDELPVPQQPTYDQVEIKQPKKSFIKRYKERIANFRKSLSNIATYTKGGIKGIWNGFIGASAVFTGTTIANSIRTTFKKVGPDGQEIIRKAIPSKPLAVAAGVLILAKNIWNSSLEASKKRSDIEHKYIGH